MTNTFVTAALKKSRELLAKINTNTNITAMDKLKQKNAALAALFERNLRLVLYDIAHAADNDRDQGWAVKKEDLDELRRLQLLFAKALEKLTGVATKIVPLN
ncbi:MAG: hypothetical protein AABY40_00525 [Nanoarchaeota archaeon]